MERDFGFETVAKNRETFEDVLYSITDPLKELVETDFNMLTIGRPVDRENFSSYTFRFIGDDKLVNIQEENSSEPFDHEINLLKDSSNVLRGILIKLYAPQQILPIFACPFGANVDTSSTPTEKLDKIFNCLPELKKYIATYREQYIEVMTKLQKRAINEFLRHRWISAYGYRDPEYLILGESYGREYNPYTCNQNLGWVKNQLVTLITFCTPKFGSSYGIGDDYFSDIEEYQSGKKRYPILRCLITSLKEARESKYISIRDFLEYYYPMPNLGGNDY